MKPQGLIVALLFVVFNQAAYGQGVVPQEIAISDRVALHYVERGAGEPIIFIHGLLGEYSVWTRQLEGFANQGYRAIAYSRRYNYPNKNKLRPNHSASVEAADLARFIRKLELKNAHVVGYSYGAYTALILALEHPELIRTLTLSEPPIAPWLSDLPDGQSEDGKAHLKKLMNEGVNPAKAAFESGDDELAMRTMFDCIGGKGKFERLPEFVKIQCRRNINEMKAIIYSKDRYPAVSRDQVRRLNVPTLILSGSKSVATARLTDPELARLIPKRSRKRVVLPGATHIMWVEQPVQSREAVLKFIRQRREFIR